MQNQLGTEYPPELRKQFLADNCERMEDMGYTRQYTEDELMVLKDHLADVDIEIDSIETQKKNASDEFSALLKPLRIQRKETLTNFKNKAEYVTESCYVFHDYENRKVGYYNKDGILVSVRTMRPGEMQKTLPFTVNRTDNLLDSGKTGTND